MLPSRSRDKEASMKARYHFSFSVIGIEDRAASKPVDESLRKCCRAKIQLSRIVVVLFTLAGCSGGTETSERDLVPARLAALGREIPVQIDAREFPLQISPRGDFEDCVTDEQLITALSASLPLWEPPSVPTLFHELRLWRFDASFPSSLMPEGEERSGRFMAATLLSDAECKKNTVQLGKKDYIIDSPYGFHVVRNGTLDSEHYRGEGHYGQLLMVLAEAGVPLTAPVESCTGRVGTIRHLLQDASMRYSPALEQDFIFALALWLPPGQAQWSNEHGNVHKFDDVVTFLLAKPLGVGACGGVHAVYAVTILLRVDEEHPILADSVRTKALRWLANVAAILERTQKREGGWDKRWPASDAVGFIYGDKFLDAITVTGHHLEWMAYAPKEIELRSRTIADACRALDSSLRNLPAIENRSFKATLPCSHAARALCALRGEQPSVLFDRFWKLGLKKTSYGFTRGDNLPERPSIDFSSQ